MTERIDISGPLHELCALLGLSDYQAVVDIHITPGTVAASVYRRNENGAKYIDPDTNDAAKDTLEIAVKT